MRPLRRVLTVFALLLPLGCSVAAPPAANPAPAAVAASPVADKAAAAGAKTERAIFAGGCFWCTEADFEKMPGVVSAVSGYISGKVDNPSYEEVSSGSTGHTEAVEVVFDPGVVTYAQLVEQFWPTIDPTVKDAQFCDRGSQYRSGIYPLNAAQQAIAEASKAALAKSGRVSNVYTEIVPATTFWPAEAYHQDYYKTNALKYKYYRYGCGRDARLAQIWKR